MLWNNLSIYAFIWATLFAAECILGQQFYRKPWPTYSLQNMPQTQFTCHDKILGGYYADAETQCQMFHVCVKVAGVGVQDFRFLCPNGTAFDQEAQICADWGDVDCEQSVLYYGSDNFDLYRIGSGFESKRAPLAEEEEATFHLQRAETADVRRSKETRVDQKSRPDQPPNYTKQFEAATARNLYGNHLNGNTNQRKSFDVVKRPIVNYYTPTTTTTTTTSTSTTTTTERSNSIDESRQEYDDIFKGSHSSHFFSNRNGGREDEVLEYSTKSKTKDYVNFNKKVESSTLKSQSPTARQRRVQSTSSSTSSTTNPPASKKHSINTSFNNNVFGVTQYYKASTPASTATAFTTTTSTSTSPKPTAAQKRLLLKSDPYQTQEKIQPTTYNPSNSAYQFKTTPTPKYNNIQRGTNQKQQHLEKSSKVQSKPTATARKIQKLERVEKFGPRNSSFVNHNEFAEFSKINLEQPKPFQPVQTFRAPPPPPPQSPAAASRLQSQEPQYFRTRGQKVQQSRVGAQDPAPFSAPKKNKEGGTDITTSKLVRLSTPTPELSARGFTNRGSLRASTQRSVTSESLTPTTTQSSKKFSTLVPREVYTPTTYKPVSVKSKDYNSYQTQQTARPSNRQQKPFAAFTTTPEPTTVNPYYNPDEDDGQYHPELYEVDFPRNRLNIQRSSTTTSTKSTTSTKKPYAFNHRFDSPQAHLKTQQQSAFQKEQDKPQSVDLSDEEELFKTAHSLNFGAASINKLRADIIKAEKTSQQYNSQYSPNLVQSSSPKVTAPTLSPTAKTSSKFPTTTTQLFTASPTTTTTSTTTKRPFTYLPTTTTPKSFYESKPTKSSKLSKSKGKKASSKTTASKRPPHADEDTSYDYAYYDSDTLSESPQEYPEYEIAEFTKTRKN